MSNLKKIFVVSDVHGHYTLLKDALDKAGFDKNDENHFLVCLGDYFDRGNENVAVLKFFESLKHKALLKGNHEDLLLKVLQTGKLAPHNLINGTMTTLENFFGKYSVISADNSIDFSGKTKIVERLCEFITQTTNFFETENYLFVHGWIPAKCRSLRMVRKSDDKAWEEARWTRWTDMYDGKRPLKDKTLICGHMPTFFAYEFDNKRKKGDTGIFYANGMNAIDAGTFDTGKVNVLVIEDNLI